MDTTPHNQPPAGKNVQKVRSLFLSDIHLGSRACRAAELLDFLKGYEASNIFLLGDIVDFWAMSRNVDLPVDSGPKTTIFCRFVFDIGISLDIECFEGF